MGASTTRAPSGAQNRLSRARLALRLAEERTGLRDSAALKVQRALSSASTSTLLSASVDSSRAAPPTSPASSTALSTWQDSGVLTLQGSTTLLLAALALRQGEGGWCGVIGGDELGWCAATEVGLDLNRVLTVPASVLDDSSAPTIASTLLDGVDSLLIGASTVARLRPRHRRRLLARAHERGRLILTPAPWEGARTLQSEPLPPDTGTEDVSPAQATAGPSTGSSADGVVVPIGRKDSPAVAQGTAQAVEMPAGYLRRLTWTLTDPRCPQLATPGALTLSLSAEGLRICSHDVVEAAADPREAAG